MPLAQEETNPRNKIACLHLPVAPQQYVWDKGRIKLMRIKKNKAKNNPVKNLKNSYLPFVALFLGNSLDK